jgi:HAD superfamily hydrolase (TIGR01458 family)
MARAVLLDIDGVLAVSWEPIPGAADTVRWLTDRRIDFRLVTNSSSKSAVEISALLRKGGISAPPGKILSAVSSAAHYLAVNFPGKRCLIVNEGNISEELHGVEEAGSAAPEVVLLGGAGPSTGYEAIDRAFKLAMDGVPIVALHRNTRYQTSSGPALDMGAFILGLEAAAGVEIPVVGKPARAFFEAALTAIGAQAANSVMVGDDVVSDVFGAQAAGITGILVRTGKFRPSDLEDPDRRPDHVINSIADLPDLLSDEL